MDGLQLAISAITWCYHQKMDKITCTWCANPIDEMTRSQRSCLRVSGRVYCSKTCSTAFRAKISSETMARTNRKFASERMKAHNPMKKPEVRERVSNALKEIGHKPPIQGGNGRGLTKAQKALSEALGWPTEVIVSIGKGNMKEGRPSHYKIDIANPAMKIAIEVDGPSHQALVVQQRDQRKTEFLRGLGWTVLRFSNQAVMDDTAGCARMVLFIT